MAKHNAANERIKRDYFQYLADAKGRDAATIDGVAKALARFEESTRHRPFKQFHREQAMAFKRRLGEANNARTGERLSKATVTTTLRHLKEFFLWLAREAGFKSHVTYADADYFSPTARDEAISRAPREKRIPTLAQAELALAAMSTDTLFQRRDRGVFALAMLTGARVGALASLQMQHVNMAEGYVFQDARDVRTKFGRTFRTYFMPVSDAALGAFRAWHEERAADAAIGKGDSLFPATTMRLGESGGFEPAGLARHGWSTSEPIRVIFRSAFACAGLPYFNPHSFRDMLVRHAMSLDLSPEEMKAWSQNLGHKDVMTTLTSYGTVPQHRQGELVRGSRSDSTENLRAAEPQCDDQVLLRLLAARLEQSLTK